MPLMPDPCFGNTLIEKLRNNPEAIVCGEKPFLLTGKQWMMAVATMREAADEIELLQNEAAQTLVFLEKATKGVRRPIGERKSLGKVLQILRGFRK